MNLVLLLGKCLTIYAFVCWYYICLIGSTVSQFMINTCLLDELLTYHIYAYVLYYIEFSYIVLINLHSHCIHVYLIFCMICYCTSVMHTIKCVIRIKPFMHYTRTYISYHLILNYSHLHELQMHVICIMCQIMAQNIICKNEFKFYNCSHMNYISFKNYFSVISLFFLDIHVCIFHMSRNN